MEAKAIVQAALRKLEEERKEMIEQLEGVNDHNLTHAQVELALKCAALYERIEAIKKGILLMEGK